MKKSAILRPVSQKAYARFVERISTVITDSTKRKAMLAALDSYLDGNRETYDRDLTPDCAMTFAMLRFEIDLAISRSAKARSRAQRKSTTPEPRKAAGATPLTTDSKHTKTTAKAKVTPGTQSTPAKDDKTIEDTPQLPRRIRRAVDRKARAKARWRKI